MKNLNKIWFDFLINKNWFLKFKYLYPYTIKIIMQILKVIKNDMIKKGIDT